MAGHATRRNALSLPGSASVSLRPSHPDFPLEQGEGRQGYAGARANARRDRRGSRREGVVSARAREARAPAGPAPNSSNKVKRRRDVRPLGPKTNL